MPLSPFTIWTDPERSRYFLLPDTLTLPTGAFVIRAPLGKRQSVDPVALGPYELSEQQAKVWVASELTGLLQALPKGPMDAGEKIIAAAHMVRTLPGIIRDSANPATFAEAQLAAEGLEETLLRAGFDTHEAISALPGRVVAIQNDIDVQDKRRAIQAELKRISEQVEIPALRQFIDQLAGLASTETGKEQESQENN